MQRTLNKELINMLKHKAHCCLRLFLALTVACVLPAAANGQQKLAWIEVSEDGSHFVRDGKQFIVWGVNYDHDGSGRLIEDYWHDEWETVQQDFAEIAELGANVVRVHLQLGRFMSTAREPDERNLEKLQQLLKLAEENGLYLDLTGLGCYHKADVPDWYDALHEADRWEVQARFWGAVANVCQESPVVFCYDLMNEPILAGKKIETDWLAGELGGKFFVQRLTLDLKDRTREEVAATWVKQMAGAIRDVDDRHLITVGVIPWALTFKGAKPLFYSPEVSEPLDFVSVHFYPEKDKVDEALTALKVYEVGKPLVVEEIFPLKAGIEQTGEFIDRSREFTDGWVSFYWGKTIKDYQQEDGIVPAIMVQWLTYFHQHAPEE